MVGTDRCKGLSLVLELLTVPQKIVMMMERVKGGVGIWIHLKGKGHRIS